MFKRFVTSTHVEDLNANPVLSLNNQTKLIVLPMLEKIHFYMSPEIRDATLWQTTFDEWSIMLQGQLRQLFESGRAVIETSARWREELHSWTLGDYCN